MRPNGSIVVAVNRPCWFAPLANLAVRPGSHAGFLVTKPVTLKALLRVCADLAAQNAEPKHDRVKRWAKRLAPWTDQVKQFRVEGFYERFPAKGQVERVARIHRELAHLANIERRGKLTDEE